MRLTVNEKCFLLQTDANGMSTAKEHGLELWAGDAKPGSYTFFTAQRDRGGVRPVHNPYQVLPLFEHGDEAAKVALMDLYLAYHESRAPESITLYEAAPGLQYAPYQSAAIFYALRRGQNVLFGDEPGLGKTVEAIGLARERCQRRILVVVPAAVRLQWRKELKRWYPELGKVSALLTGRDAFDPHADATIVSYNALQNKKLFAALMSETWDNLILDEAHFLKNHDAKRTRNALGNFSTGGGLVSRSASVTALTGTPLPNRPAEIYPLARSLAWDCLDQMAHGAFLDRFNPAIYTPAGFPVYKTSNLVELQARIRSGFMCRRAKSDVLKDLPPKRYELTTVEPNGDIKRVIKAESLLNIDPEDPTTMLDENGLIDGAIATVRREMGAAKVPSIVDHVSGLIEGGVEKVVLFLYHRDVVAAVVGHLRSFSPAVIQGGISPARREREKARFIEDPNCRVFVGQLLATGTGVDGLQHVCDRVVFGEADWVPGNNEQCVDRLHRYGQKGSVLAQFLVAPGSLDEKILGSAIRKLQAQNVALDKMVVA
jgi:SNF2 family DNA or RNA helicase